MTTQSTKIIELIKQNSTPTDEVFADFSTAQNKIVAEEIKYYDLLQTLKTTRTDMNLSQQELADRANIPRTTITKIESGSYNPTIKTLMTIASALNKKLEVRFT